MGVDAIDRATSPLDTLALLPVQFAKIDRAVAEDVDPESVDLTTVYAAARSLQIPTIAAGVETLPELALAIAHEYDFAQGPLFGYQLASPDRLA